MDGMENHKFGGDETITANDPERLLNCQSRSGNYITEGGVRISQEQSRQGNEHRQGRCRRQRPQPETVQAMGRAIIPRQALRAAPRYEMVEIEEEEGKVLNGPGTPAQRLELPALTRGPDSVSQAIFRRLDDESWLDDTILDMFIHTYVNDACDKVCCTRMHFI